MSKLQVMKRPPQPPYIAPRPMNENFELGTRKPPPSMLQEVDPDPVIDAGKIVNAPMPYLNRPATNWQDWWMGLTLGFAIGLMGATVFFTVMGGR